MAHLLLSNNESQKLTLFFFFFSINVCGFIFTTLGCLVFLIIYPLKFRFPHAKRDATLPHKVKNDAGTLYKYAAYKSSKAPVIDLT